MKNVIPMLLIAGLSAGASANVINGDFETGVLGPSTSAYSSNNIYNPEQFLIVSFDTVHNSWVDFYDHTLGTSDGHYMIVNGSDSGVGPTWAQTVTVMPNTQYTLSGWFASLFAQSIANVEFRVDGVLVNPAFSAPGTLGVWEQRSVTFTTGNVTSISIEIWDSNLAFNGNDYAIDDIAINLVPTPNAAVTLAVGSLAALRRRRAV